MRRAIGNLRRIHYGRSHTKFLTVPAIRPLALNRENALFAGSDNGGEHWAVIASLIETCKLVGVEQQAYLAEVISRIVEGHPQRHLDDLLPWAYPSTPTLQAVA